MPKQKPKLAPASGNLLEAAAGPAPVLKSDREVASAVDKVLTQRADEAVSVGGRTFQIVELKYGAERRWNPIIGPYIQFLLGAWLEGPSEFAKALSVAIAESDQDLTELALIVLQNYDPALDEAWLNENATFSEVMDLIRAQLERNKVADSLGKLWGNGVLSAKLAEALSITPRPTGPASTPPSSESASATSSTPPTS